MYLDFEDHKPDTPRVPQVISLREGVLMSLVVHLVLVILVLVAPTSFFVTQAADVEVPRPPIENPLRYVHVAPAVERPAPPRDEPAPSDMDRRAATMERPEIPLNREAFSRGNTPERVVGAPEARAAGPESPVVAPPSPSPQPPAPPTDTAGILPIETPATRPNLSGGSLGDSLRDLQRYLNQENYSNLRGGQTEYGPDIQFDSMGIDFGPWIRRFRAQVISNWNIPQAAMINRGRVVIQFDLYKTGRIANIRIVRPSSIEGFNVAAFNAIRMSNPTLPLPDDYPRDMVVFTVTFFYNDGTPHAA